MNVPFFTMNNYTALMDIEFAPHQQVDRVSIRELMATLQGRLLRDYRDLDVRQLSTFLQDNQLSGTVLRDGTQRPLEEILIACKLLCPTLRCCDYFSRNIGDGTHTGVDIMLPQNTPIVSFTDGQVVRIKTRDGNTANEGNCVAIQSDDGYVVGYEHLERIDVTVGQIVRQGDQIGLCGSTGNSTQYHLHVQVDKADAPFHPYRSRDLDEIKQWTIDPLPYFRAWGPASQFVDLPPEAHYQEAIMRLIKGMVIKGFDRKVFPDNTLKRYEAALMIDRVLRLYDLYAGRSVIHPVYTSYTDNDLGDSELDEALERLQKYGIMKGSGNVFAPKKELKGQELLALLGRIFYDLTDSTTGGRWDSYLERFVSESIVSSDRPWVGKAIPRKEVFVVMSEVLVRKGVLH